MNQIMFSILIPVYNVEKYLTECLESVIQQTYPQWEAIVIDDGSTDDSGNICDDYANRDPRIKVYHQTNVGLMMTRKEGILKASGQYCLFLDSDDYYDFSLLERVAQYLEDKPCDMVIFNKKTLYQNRCIENHFIQSNVDMIESKQAIMELVRTNDLVSIWTKVIKRNLILNHLEEIYIPVNYAEDLLQSFFFMLYADTIGILHTSLYYYRIRKSSLIHQISMKSIQETLAVDARVMQLMREHHLLNQENEAAFSINILNNFMESIYRLNHRKCSIKDKEDALTELLEKAFIQKLLKQEYYDNIIFYNRIRTRLLINKHYRTLICIDKLILPIQNILQKSKGMKGFD